MRVLAAARGRLHEHLTANHRRDACATIGGKHFANPELRQDPVFRLVHAAVLAIGSIVEAAQMQQAMEGVEEDLVGQGDATAAGLAAGLGYADVNLAGIGVEGEGEDVGWAGEVEKSLVELGHLAVADKDHREVAQGAAGEEGGGAAEVAAEEGDMGEAGLSGDGQLHATIPAAAAVPVDGGAAGAACWGGFCWDG